MDYVDGRGITNGNDVYFIYDAETGMVVMTMYKDAPGVRSDLLKPNVIKSFYPSDWGNINEFLGAGAREEEEEEEEEEHLPVPISVNIAAREESVPPRGEDAKLPKMSDSGAILPENSVPAMTKDEVQEKNEEKGDEELADATMREEKENGKE